MVTIIVGIFLILSGLFGNRVLLGTNSGAALAAVGGILVVWGLLRLKRPGS